MPRPNGYKYINAHEDSIEEARAVKEDLDVTWNEFLEQAADAIAE